MPLLLSLPPFLGARQPFTVSLEVESMWTLLHNQLGHKHLYHLFSRGLGLLALLWGGPAFALDQVGLMPIPTLQGVQVQAEASFDLGTQRYTYSYTVSHSGTSTGEIFDLKVEVTAPPGSSLFDSSGLTIPKGDNLIPFDDEFARRKPLAKWLPPGTTVVPFGQRTPAGWNGILGRDGFAGFWSPSDTPNILPGASLGGFQLISPGGPTIRKAQVKPPWAHIVEPGAEPSEAARIAAGEIERAIIVHTVTLGPSAHAPGGFAHWDRVRDDLNQAIQLGWIPDANLANNLVTQLASARQALDAGDGTVAKTRLDTLIQTITQSMPAQRRVEVFGLVLLNAQRLKENTQDTPIPFEPKLKLAPQSSTLPLGTLYDLTATVINLGDPANPPIPGFDLGFQVVEGPHTGQGVSGVTDADGKLNFSYVGTQVGTDKITAGIFGEAIEELGSAEVTWSGGPDLAVPLFTPPLLKSEGGKTVFVTEWTSNLGSVASPPSTTRYFISADATVDPATARVIGERAIPTIAPGERSESGTVTFTLPSDLPAGAYRLAACADAPGTVVELNEQNNCSFSEVEGVSTIVMPLELVLDAIPPTTTATASPGPNTAGWNNTDVTVTLTATDNPGGSGVQAITYTLTGAQTGGSSVTASTTAFLLSAEGATTVTYHATDNAGNVEADKTLVIKIDKTPPTLMFGATTPAPNAAGWNNTTPVTIAYAATDTLSGVAATSLSSPLRFTVETSGATQTVTVTDVAGNSASFISPVVKIDTTPPEAFNQFDPATKDVVVFGRDALSGVAPVPIVPLSVVSTRWGDGEGDDDKDSTAEETRKAKEKEETKREDRDEDQENAELRTYKVIDVAGNALLLVEKVKREGHEIKVRIVRLQYQSGPVLTPPRNKKEFEWAGEKDGPIKELEQRMAVRKGQARQEVEAKFEREKNQTTIKVEEPKPETKVVKPGLVLLRMVTDKGQLDIEF
jgi:hypothetical protein